MTSYPFVIEKYTHPIITVETAKEWLRMDIGYDGEDNIIQEVIDAAVDTVERGCNLQLGISTYEWNPSHFPLCFGDVPYVKEIVSIHSGLDEVINTNYSLRRTSERSGSISWISAYERQSGDHKVVFKAGFEEGKVPPMLLKAVRALIAAEFDTREDVVAEKRTLSDKIMNKFQLQYAG